MSDRSGLGWLAACSVTGFVVVFAATGAALHRSSQPAPAPAAAEVAAPVPARNVALRLAHGAALPGLRLPPPHKKPHRDVSPPQPAVVAAAVPAPAPQPVVAAPAPAPAVHAPAPAPHRVSKPPPQTFDSTG